MIELHMKKMRKLCECKNIGNFALERKSVQNYLRSAILFDITQVGEQRFFLLSYMYYIIKVQ